MKRLELKNGGTSGVFQHCGGTDVYLQLYLINSNQNPCTTSTKGAFYGGDTLIWSNSEMGSCTNKLFDVGLRNLKFKLKTNVGGDAFCPTTLVITLYDDVGKIYRYKAYGMNDWVGKDLNDHIRTATKL